MHFALIQYFFSVDIRADSYRSTVKYKKHKTNFFYQKNDKNLSSQSYRRRGGGWPNTD